KQKFDAIVDFAEVEPFIDTPVKRYSSGMYLRLAFAVGIHTRPDILLVDEVLAVGDVAFVGKCMAAIQELRRSGVTILVVSHNMWHIQTVCDRALVLVGGRLVYAGEPPGAIARYRTLAPLLSVGESNGGSNQAAATPELAIEVVDPADP